MKMCFHGIFSEAAELHPQSVMCAECVLAEKASEIVGNKRKKIFHLVITECLILGSTGLE